MKNLLRHAEIDSLRIRGGKMIEHYGSAGNEHCGAFTVPSPIDGAWMIVIASDGDGWDHVSVSRAGRCPNWTEMEYVKRLFFEDGEIAFELHVPVDAHISVHPYCLHLWRPNAGQAVPLPPSYMVA